MGLPGAPLQDAARCPSPPPGTQRYIIYKVLKFGVSWGGTTACPLGSFFYFLKITLGTAVLAAGGICPSPCTTPAAAWAGGRGGTVPVIIKHEFNFKKKRCGQTINRGVCPRTSSGASGSVIFSSTGSAWLWLRWLLLFLAFPRLCWSWREIVILNFENSSLDGISYLSNHSENWLF